MDVHVLRNFLVVVREGNITRAAESLHIAQSSLSKQLIDLEDELGRKLLIRGKRKISLTEDGIFLRRRAEEIVALMDRTERELADDISALRGEVLIGGAPTEEVLHSAVRLREEHPGIRFHFHIGDATDIYEKLDHGNLDFAVLPEPVDIMKYEYLPLSKTDRWGLIMPCSSHLAAKDSVSREDLRTIPLIFHRREGLQRDICLWAGAEPDDLDICATYNLVYGSPAPYVRSGLGFFLVTEEHFDSAADNGICFRPLEPPLELHYVLVWKRHPVFNMASQAFLETIRSEIKEGK